MAESTESKTKTGGCLCGAIKYSLQGSPIYNVICHCINCRRISGTAFVTNSIFSQKNFQLDEASIPKIKAFQDGDTDSGSALKRHFCMDCGSPIYVTSAAYPHMASVTSGTLDEPFRDQWIPQMEQYCSTKATWLSDNLCKEDLEGKYSRGPGSEALWEINESAADMLAKAR